MELTLSRKLERNEEYRAEITKLAREYIKLGSDSLDYWMDEFDSAYDVVMCYAPLTKEDFSKLERGHPRRFILPMTATQITTMSTYIAQVLFGQATPWSVEGRGPEDELPAEFVNQLLRWNAEQQQTYLLGYLWVQDCLTVNRGIFYNHWEPIYDSRVIVKQLPDPEDIDPDTGKFRLYNATRRENVVVGGYCRMDLVSPYDWICDPALPLWRLQEHRFCGHRTRIAWQDLERRSKLAVDHPAYVMPWAVAELKEKRTTHNQGAAPTPTNPTPAGGNSNARFSRTAYERGRAASPVIGSDRANKADPGIIECWELWVKLVPKDNKIHDGEDSTIFQILIGNNVVLAVNESPLQHGMFPYSVAEGRPNGHYQFSPGWVMILNGLQRHIDWLKNRHHDALSRTIGNIFVFDPSAVDVDDFMNPEKEGLLITLKPEAQGKKISEVFQQVPIKDMTENFLDEAAQFIRFSETVTGATSQMQGQSDGEGSATEYAGSQQMSAGRMTSTARLLSSQGLVPQTQQFVANFQQFLTIPQMVRFESMDLDLPLELQSARSIEVNRDTIQGRFDYIAHDGTLPGTDAKKVAAISRVLEASAVFPQVFVPAPGNLDPRLLIYGAAKASGLNLENFTYKNIDTAPPSGAAPVPPAPGAVPPVEPPASVQAPGPKPELPAVPELEPPSVLPVGPPEIRPETI